MAYQFSVRIVGIWFRNNGHNLKGRFVQSLISLRSKSDYTLYQLDCIKSLDIYFILRLHHISRTAACQNQCKYSMYTNKVKMCVSYHQNYS